MADANSTLDLTRRLSRAARTVKMYGNDHPQSRSDIDNLKKGLDRTMSLEPKTTFVLQGNALLVQEIVQPFKDPATTFLIDSLRSHGVTSITFHAGVAAPEIERVLKILGAKPQDVLEGNNLRSEHTQGYDRVRLNDIKYVAVSGGDAVVHASQVLPAGADASKVASAIHDLTAQADARNTLFGSPGPGTPVPAVAAGPATLEDLFPRVQDLARQGNLGDAQRLVVDFISKAVVPGTVPLGQQIREAMDRIPEGLRGSLAAPAVQEDVSGAVLARNLDGGASPEELQKTFKEFAPNVGDAMVLLEAVARALRASGQGASIETLEKAMRFLPQLEQVQALLTGNVLIVHGNAERRASWKQALSEVGYVVDTAASAKEGLELLLSKANYDALVMDVNLPDRSGGTILSKLTRQKMIVPVVIASPKATTYQFDFEIFSYPKKKFVVVLEPPAIVEAVKEMATRREKAIDEAEQAERTRSREIQEQLLPKQYPPTPGWEVAHLYQPAGDVGGDYLDVFQVDAGRVGLIVGDVSGKGYSAAMVMVMVRSAFRMATAGIASARDAAYRVNRLVSPDVKKGMFITLGYGCLDVPSGRLSLVNCAHNPPFHYSARTKTVRMLASSGLPMGLGNPERFEASVSEEEMELEPGDHLVFYTDGVVEAMNAKKDELGEGPAMEAVKSAAAKGPRAVVDAINAAISKHRDTAPQSDDITILDLCREGGPAPEEEPAAEGEEIPRTLLDE
ncbi:MAG: SpoIIE family protein phosphatase [Planctomycetes bacterium]|nr:SpoIIE family protein phosphatase [Planctomycetota bacterium]